MEALFFKGSGLLGGDAHITWKALMPAGGLCHRATIPAGPCNHSTSSPHHRCPHLMGRSAIRCRPLAVTLKVILPSIQRPRVARYMALRKANQRMELATCIAEQGGEG